MTNKIFVGGLSWNTREDTMESLFAEVGPLSSVKIIKDRETGRSRGFGFVEFMNDGDAEAAIERLDGVELDGRNLKISIAQERAPRQDRGRSYDRDSSMSGHWQ